MKLVEGVAYLDVSDAVALIPQATGCPAHMSEGYLRDRGKLDAALHRPINWKFHERADIATQAAVLAHGWRNRSASSMGTNAWPPCSWAYSLLSTAR